MNLPSDMKTAGPAAKRAGVRNIIYRRGTALPVHNNFFNHYLFRKVITHIIANSYETKNLLVKNNPRLVDSDKVQVIYNGIDFNKFDNQPVNPLYTKSGNELVLGNASRFVEQKGHKYLIEIAQKLKKNNIPFRLLLAGEGHLKNSIIKMAKKEGVYQNIIFTGFISDIKSFMASVDIFLLTSLWEGFGYVIVEAMADKKPVLAFNISSNPEIIEDGKNGFLIPYSDTGIFTERIVTLYRNPGLIEQMGRQARISVRENFDIKKTSKKIEKLIRESQ
jgi:glycosyltransferase involved in cell wall biosynthesis